MTQYAQVALSTMRRLYEVSAQISARRSLHDTMQAVVDGVVSGLGYGVAVASLRHEDGRFEAIAVAGSVMARNAVLGKITEAEVFDLEFARADVWGALRYVPHHRLEVDDDDPGWVPDVAVPEDPDAWHPLDALFAPLLSPSGDLVGVLSVDLPEDGRRPDQTRRELLELFALQAGIAIDAARLAEGLEDERRRLQASEQAFRLAFTGSSTGMAAVSLRSDHLGRYLLVNTAYCQMVGRSREYLLSHSLVEYLETAGPDLVDQVFGVANQSGNSFRAERQFRLSDDQLVWLSVVATPIDPGESEESFLIVQIEDINERMEHQRVLEHDARHDSLTGLPNRRLLTSRLQRAHARARQGTGASTLLFCDLNGFKAVNDLHGHSTGDRALKVIATRLLEQVRKSDTVARLGGDEFVILVDDMHRDDLQALIRRVIAAVSAPIAGVEVTVTVSVGIAEVDGSTDVERLLSDADAAMYLHKASRLRGTEYESTGGSVHLLSESAVGE